MLSQACLEYAKILPNKILLDEMINILNFSNLFSIKTEQVIHKITSIFNKHPIDNQACITSYNNSLNITYDDQNPHTLHLSFINNTKLSGNLLNT